MREQSLFIKACVVGFLALALLVPLALIQGQVHDRAAYRDQAAASIATSWTGGQTLVGPLLVVPYTVQVEKEVWDRETEKYRKVTQIEDRRLVLPPASLTARTDIGVEKRQRGIFAVPVYTSQHHLRGTFDLGAVRRLPETEGFRSMAPPYLAIHIADTRGIGDPEVEWAGAPVVLASGSRLPGLPQGISAQVTLPEGEAASADFRIALLLRGTRHFAFAPVGDRVSVDMQSTWPHPSFGGRYLPSRRSVSDDGFRAQWQLNQFATSFESLLRTCMAGDCGALASNVFDVTLTDPVDVYVTTGRSAKYGILFVVLTFVAFLLTEVLTGLRIHPVQYLFVGMGLCIFFLLLLALAEHIGFGLAYLAAATACTLLLSYYVRHVAGSMSAARRFAGAVTTVYAALYVTLLSEDYALLMGSGLLFLVLAAAMVLTRHIDWHAINGSTAKG